MTWIPTALSTLAALLAFYFARLAFFNFSRAHDSELRASKTAIRLQELKGDVDGHGSHIDSHAAQLNRLRGMVYALRRVNDERTGEAEVTPLAPHPRVGLCENWKAAQVEGPLSVAASCECDFCTQMRREKDAVRKQFRPTPGTMPTGLPT